MAQTMAAQILAVVLVLVIVLGPAVVALLFLSRRKKLAHRARRSPLSTHLLRTPGHTLRERLEEGRSNLGDEIAVLMVMPAVVLAFLYLAGLFTGRTHSTWVLVTLAVVVAGFTIHRTRKILSGAKQLEQWGLGLDAEMAAGQELEQLMRQGAVVFHDLAAEKFKVRFREDPAAMFLPTPPGP